MRLLFPESICQISPMLEALAICYGSRNTQSHYHFDPISFAFHTPLGTTRPDAPCARVYFFHKYRRDRIAVTGDPTPRGHLVHGNRRPASFQSSSLDNFLYIIVTRRWSSDCIPCVSFCNFLPFLAFSDFRTLVKTACIFYINSTCM
jgi:hypothetical protein